MQSIAITPATPSMAKGVAVKLTATGTYSDGTSKDISSQVSWSSASSAASVNAAGLTTGLAVGQAQISATAGGITGKTNVTVTPAILMNIGITALPTLYKGQTHVMSASGTFSDGTTQDISNTVNWSSSVPAVGEISASGTLTGVSMGNTIVMATLNGVSGNTTVAVSAAALQSIALTPTASAIAKGQTQQMTAMGTYADGTTQTLTGVTWTSSNSAVASVSASGLVTAVSAGSATLTGTLSGVSANAVLTVKAATLQLIGVTPASPTIITGQTQQLTATGKYSDGSSQALTGVAWTSGNTAVATVNASGLVTAVSAGTATITGALGGVSAKTTFTVAAAELQSIAVTPALPTIEKGQMLPLTATGTYTNGISQVLQGVTWSSSRTSVATVNSAGVVTGVSAGSATIEGRLNFRSGFTTVTVTATTLQSIQVTPTSPNLVESQTQQLTATGLYSDGTSHETSGTWTSSNTSVATVNALGMVTAVAAGTATITVTSNGVSASAAITVTAAELLSFAVAVVPPESPIISQGQTVHLYAGAVYSTGSRVLTTGVTWTSLNPAVATVDSKGLVRAVSTGTATIEAEWNGRRASKDITVVVTFLSSKMIPASPSITMGQTQQLRAVDNYSDGSSKDWTGVTWVSKNTAVATVDTRGLVKAVAAGTAEIQATAILTGRLVSTTVTVLPR